MKRQIRFGVFETNSSSTHSLTIFTKEEWDEWCNGNLYINRWGDYKLPKFVSTEELKERFPLTDELKEYYETEDEYWNCELGFKGGEYGDEYLESDVNYYTTPGGEELVLYCTYGYDG